MCSKLTIMIQERRHWRCSGVFFVNIGHISRLALALVLLTLNMKLSAGKSEYNLEFQGSVRNVQKRALFMKFYPEMP